MKVMLIEDSASIRKVLMSTLTDAGHEVCSMSTGDEALASDELSISDLILLDVEMPGLNGFDTCKIIRQKTPHWIPIIFLSAHDDDASFQAGIDAGGDDYLAKPVSHVILNAKLKAMQRIAEMRDRMEAMNKSLEHLSRSDSLTGLYNRRAFFDVANRDWQAAARHDTQLSIAIFDIDYFKPYNDYYGHPEGDTCLSAVAHCLEVNLQRDMDVVARYGGEEFILILPNTDLQGAQHVAERLCLAVEDLQLPHATSPTSHVVTVSVGVCTTLSTAGSTLEDLIKQADIALYEAKDQGRNHVVAKALCARHTACLFETEKDIKQESHIAEMLDGLCNLIRCNFNKNALSRVLEHQPDIILIDHSSNNQHELDLCRKLKEDSRTSFIPIILMAKGKIQELKSLAKKIKVNDYVEKPIIKDRLTAKIKTFLN